MGTIPQNTTANKSSMTVQEKEQVIVGTILYCNSVIKQLNENFNKKSKFHKLFETDAIHFNMINLASKITGEGLSQLNENVNQFVSDNNFVKMNEHQNHYAYFQKVKSFLNGFEIPTQHSLNESITIKQAVIRPLGSGHNQSTTAQQQISNIDTFKKQLNAYISELEKNNDTENYTQQILNIKLFANKPLFVYGFNIANSIVFQQEICTKFNKNAADLLTILFEKSEKYLMFVFKNDIITYSVKDDNLNKMNINFKFDERNFVDEIGNNISRNTVMLHRNISGITFTDNLYKDSAHAQLIENMRKSNSKSIIK